MARAAAEEARDDLGIDDRAARRDAPNGVGQVGDAGDAVLEQVADARRILAQEVDRVARLDVLRQDEDRRLGCVGADHARRLEALGRMGRRHADVDDGDVGALQFHEPQELGYVAGLADDLETGAASAAASASRRRTASSASTIRIARIVPSGRGLPHRCRPSN